MKKERFLILIVVSFISVLPHYVSGQSVDFDQLGQKMEELNRAGMKIKDYSYFKKVLDLAQDYANDPNNRSSLFYNELGVALYNLEKKEDARKYYEKAFQLKPTDPVIAYNLGFILGKLGNKSDSIYYLKKSLQINPNHEYARNAKAWLEYYQK